MKAMLNRLVFSLIMCGCITLGCSKSGGDGDDLDYNGNWNGKTSNGGSVTFTVSENKVTALEIKDDDGSIRLREPIGIDGDSFSASCGPSWPMCDLSCTFDSATHCTGSYSITGIGSVSGTFEASGQPSGQQGSLKNASESAPSSPHSCSLEAFLYN
jgi:hypothetical protein